LQKSQTALLYISVKIYIVAGMQRSGHHAVVLWLGKHIGDHHHINDVREPSPQLRNKYKQNVILSYENKSPEMFYDESAEKVLVVIRDPYNWLASRLKKRDVLYYAFTENTIPRYKRLIEYATRNDLPSNVICVNYNRWFSEKIYRQEIIESCGLVFTDQGINQIPEFGNGSSFTECKYDGKAQEMKVLSRWKLMKNNDQYRRLILKKHPELQEIAANVFGMSKPPL